MNKKKTSAPELVRPDHEFKRGGLEIRHDSFRDGTNLHWHDYFEMEVITQGNGSYYINGMKFPLRRGSVYLVTPVDFHLIKGDFEICNLAFTEAMVSQEVLDRIVSANPTSVVTFEEDEFSFIEKTLKKLQNEYEKDSLLRDEAMKALLDYVLISYLRRIEHADEDVSRSDIAVMRVVSYIKFNFKKKLTLAEAADAVHLTSNYVGEIFTKRMGITFNAYLMQTRLNYAKNLLMRGNCSVEEVALNSGFGSQTYFSDCFKKQFGYTPTAVRQKAMQGLLFDDDSADKDAN